ncbi:MAG: FAD-dependent oxidoreductase [Planctomycetota bacterium]
MTTESSEFKSMESMLGTLPVQLHERTIVMNDRDVRTTGEFVLCWLHHAVRDHENPVLDVAITLGNALKRPVLVYLGLAGAHPYNSDRHHMFILQGARDLVAGLRERGVASIVHCPDEPQHESPIRALIRSCCLMVTEDFPVPPMSRWTVRHASDSPVAVAAVDSSCLMPMRMLERRFTRAFKFRDAAKREWAERIARPCEEVSSTAGLLDLSGVESHCKTVDFSSEVLHERIARCTIDHGIPPVQGVVGGSCAGYRQWTAFLQHGLKSYAKRRNNALDTAGVSQLSPYLHYGHVSPFRIAREANAVGGAGSEKFLDELLVWRELAFNFCAYTSPDVLESLDALPDWARKSLRRHADDTRHEVLSHETLARGTTGDPLWDAAQMSLLRLGSLHNNVRMTWGKAIPGWTPCPDTALRMLIDLNHRYALDGNDPNSYGGLLWCLGQFDRPFDPPTRILGSVRARSTEQHAERLDPAAFGRSIEVRAAGALRIAVIGGGIAGLSCARVLHDQGMDVTVFDKGRGFGGRTSTRRTPLPCGSTAHFDHGAPFFTANDDRFQRVVRSWIQDGHVAPWRGRVAGAGDAMSDAVRLVGTPGMNAICRHLGSDLDVQFNVRVTGLTRAAAGWTLTCDGDLSFGGFDVVVCAMPADQTRALLQPVASDLATAMDQIVTSPTWVGMVAIRGPIDALPDMMLFDDHNVLAKVVCDSNKPGRGASGVTNFVAHTMPAWTREHLEDDREAVANLIRDALLEVLEASASQSISVSDVVHQAAHRWRFAQCVQVHDNDCVADFDMRVVICGDGFRGHGVEAAWLSGQAAAGRCLAMREAPISGTHATLFEAMES